MILGIGIDTVQIPKNEKILSRDSDLFIKNYFGVDEVAKYADIATDTKKYAQKIAKLFSAKEAFVKALGTGFRFGIELHDIQVVADTLGAPQLKLGKSVISYLEKTYPNYGDFRYHISLSDDYPIATAFVIIEY